MNRTILEAQRGADTIRSVVRIEDDPNPGEGMAGFMALGLLLQRMAEQPHLLRHASDCPRSVSFIYDGHRWVVESETFTARDPNE